VAQHRLEDYSVEKPRTMVMCFIGGLKDVSERLKKVSTT
jgi:hypothetical protein